MDGVIASSPECRHLGAGPSEPLRRLPSDHRLARKARGTALASQTTTRGPEPPQRRFAPVIGAKGPLPSTSRFDNGVENGGVGAGQQGSTERVDELLSRDCGHSWDVRASKPATYRAKLRHVVHGLGRLAPTSMIRCRIHPGEGMGDARI